MKQSEMKEFSNREELQRSVRELVRRQDGDAKVELIRMALELEDHAKVWLLEVLDGRGDPSSRCIARALSASNDRFVRDAATVVMGRVGVEGDLECLSLRLVDRLWVVRASAASSIGEIGASEGLELLRCRWPKERQADVRRYIAVALSEGSGEIVVPVLEEWLTSEKADEARIGILFGLVRNRQARHVAELLRLLQSEDTHVCALAITAFLELREFLVLDPSAHSELVGSLSVLSLHPVGRVNSLAESALEEYLG